MATKQGVTATAELQRVIENWPPLEHDYVLRSVEARTAEFVALYEKHGPVEFVKAFYDLFADVMSEQKVLPSCSKGCHFCCRRNVQIWPAEAAAIAEFCQDYDIPIPREHLERQLKHGWKEVAKTDDGWCVFLKNGECSIYDARPLSCRKYLVASRPEMCDTVKYPADQGHRVQVIVLTVPEIEASAFCAVMSRKAKADRLPQLLLPYSK
jgi:Fe-S-cluster containining protein